MASDSLQKSPRFERLGFVEWFHLCRTRFILLLQRQGLVPKTWWPWHVIPVLFRGILAATWFVISSFCGFASLCFVTVAVSFGWNTIITPLLALIWTNFVPESIKTYIHEVNWTRVGFKVFSRVLLAVYALMILALFYSSPWGFGGDSWPDLFEEDLKYAKPDLERFVRSHLLFSCLVAGLSLLVNSYFDSFTGATRCNLRASDLYAPLVRSHPANNKQRSYCSTRSALLTALSSGGRHGFDAPYASSGCAYRWYSVPEICAIFSRFDAVIFVGDDMLATIYAGLNILLRRDLQYGALSPTSRFPVDQFDSCGCDNQFSNVNCHQFLLRNSKEMTDISQTSTYTCLFHPLHALLEVNPETASTESIAKFNSLVRSGPRSSYRPIPIVHSVTSAISYSLAAASLSDFLNFADASGRKTPMLWIGPPASGHLDVKGRKSNEEIWRFATEMNDLANKKDVDSLGVWNLTVQANSDDGVHFGDRVGIVGAMMVINWLAMLESS